MSIFQLIMNKIFALIFVVGFSSGVAALEPALVKLLPAELDGWTQTNELYHYEGEDLFFLINGGADVYLEYGFSQVISAGYTRAGGGMLRVELYEMLDRDAAFGIYTLFATMDQTTAYGPWGRKGNTYIRFLAGNYIVVILLEREIPEGEAQLIGFADFLSKQLPENTGKPGLVSMLPDAEFILPGVKYFRGHLGLMNIYGFGTEDIFGFAEGVWGDYGTHRLMIMEFESVPAVKQMFEKIPVNLHKIRKFSSISIMNSAITCRDNQGNSLVMEPFKNYLLIFIGPDPILQPELFERIREGEEFIGEDSPSVFFP